MTAMPVAQPMIAQEFLALPVPERGRPWNLIDGEVVVNEPAALHGHVHTNLLLALGNWSRAKPGRGHAVLPRDVGIDRRNVFQPDVLWYAEGRLPDPYSPPPYAMPDIAIEVRSPSTWRYDIGAKKAIYERHRLPELWLADTVASTALIFRRSRPGAPGFDVAAELEAGDELTSPLLPGFALPIAEAFRIP